MADQLVRRASQAGAAVALQQTSVATIEDTQQAEAQSLNRFQGQNPKRNPARTPEREPENEFKT